MSHCDTSPVRKRVLFLLKHRDFLYTDESNGCYSYGHLCSGLLNSARLVADMLRDQLGYYVELVQVRDNNQIDREVTRFRPDICVIEAYWVVPEKFKVLHRRHPRVKWVVRNHSSMPFLALEGVVMEWSLAYVGLPNVYLACNDARTDEEFAFLVGIGRGWTEHQVREKVVLLPNYYPAHLHNHVRGHRRYLHVSCFGAIRPLKNHLIQAVAAIKFAEKIRKPLKFHINATRIEQMAQPVLKNLRALFAGVSNRGHLLIEHSWLKRPEFLNLCAKMDLGLNVSFSETFSINSADLTTHGVPVVTSEEVSWVNPAYFADEGNSDDIARKMNRAFTSTTAVRSNLRGLASYSERSRIRWERFTKNLFVDSE
jgi:hypothetical protein